MPSLGTFASEVVGFCLEDHQTDICHNLTLRWGILSLVYHAKCLQERSQAV